MVLLRPWVGVRHGCCESVSAAALGAWKALRSSSSRAPRLVDLTPTRSVVSCPRASEMGRVVHVPFGLSLPQTLLLFVKLSELTTIHCRRKHLCPISGYSCLEGSLILFQFTEIKWGWARAYTFFLILVQICHSGHKFPRTGADLKFSPTAVVCSHITDY